MKRYAREFLLSFADQDFCKQRPEALDPMLWRDSPSPEIVESGAPPAKFVPRREREFPQDVPEWRRPSNGSGLLSQQSHRRKTSEEDGVWIEARSQHERAAPAARWDHRGRGGHQAEPGPDRSGGTRGNWTSTEPDGLLGSGNGLRGPMMGGRGSNGRGRGSRSNDSRSTKSFGEDDTRYGEDTFNSETFGQSESDDSRAEEERKRRESFERERKAQQTLKEQKKQPKKRDFGSEDDLDALIGPASTVEHDLPDDICVVNLSQTNAVVPPPSTAPRPLVPPGFGHAKPVQKDNKETEQTNGVEEPVDKPVVLERSSSSLMQRLDPIVIACSNVSASEPFLHTKFEGREKVGGNEDKDAMDSKGVTASGGRMLPMPVGPSLQDIEKDIVTTTVKAAAGAFTCQDLEQSLLAEAEGKVQGVRGGQKEGGSGKDSDVSHQLLALLQKGSARQWDEDFSEQALEAPPAAPPEVNQEGGAPTLESLFGRAFMMELRSTDAPLSAKVVAETKYIDNLSLVRKPHKLEDGLTGMLTHDTNQKLVESVPSDADQFKYQRAKEPRQEPPVREMDGLLQDSSIVDYAGSSNGHIDGLLPGFFPPKPSSLQQLHQALSKPAPGSNKQFQPGLSPPNMFDYGAPDSGYGRPVNVHPQGIYGGHLPTPQGFGSPFFLEQEQLKQRGQTHGGHPFPPNGSVQFQQQKLNQLLLQRQQKHPVMGYHLSSAGGYMGHAADEHAAAAAAATERWLGRDPSSLVQQQQQQQHRVYGNKLGFR